MQLFYLSGAETPTCYNHCMTGAKKKYTKELAEEIAKNIMSGLSAKDAVALAGIDESTYYCWLNPEDKNNP
jgi:hypothetical protein